MIELSEKQQYNVAFVRIDCYILINDTLKFFEIIFYPTNLTVKLFPSKQDLVFEI